jgi:hypothetical protein
MKQDEQTSEPKFSLNGSRVFSQLKVDVSQ